jgi:hypothetical protein
MPRAALAYLPSPASPRPARSCPQPRRKHHNPFSRYPNVQPKPRLGVKNYAPQNAPSFTLKTHANPPRITPVADKSVVGCSVAAERGLIGPPSFTTRSGEAYFWSGLGRGGAETAAGVARRGGGTTLEMFIESRGINMPVWDAANPASIKAWQDVSRVYASSASGEVRAVVGSNLRHGNIWQSVELPALQRNPNVSRVIQVNPTTGAESVLWGR